jgi:hypothetical protein
MLSCKNLRDRSVVVFVEYREVPTVRYCQTSSATAETALRRCRQKRENEEAYVEGAYVRQVLSCFDLILLANQGDSPGQPKRSLRVATAVRYNCYVQLVATKRIQNFGAFAKGGVDFHPSGKNLFRYGNGLAKSPPTVQWRFRLQSGAISIKLWSVLSHGRKGRVGGGATLVAQ